MFITLQYFHYRILSHNRSCPIVTFIFFNIRRSTVRHGNGLVWEIIYPPRRISSVLYITSPGLALPAGAQLLARCQRWNNIVVVVIKDTIHAKNIAIISDVLQLGLKYMPFNKSMSGTGICYEYQNHGMYARHDFISYL